MTDPLARYRALVAKVDAFWERALAAQPAEFCCVAGCDDCCRQRLTVFPVEGAVIRAHLSTMDPQVRARLRANADELHRCAFGLDGRCAIYPARPIICRTHGLPLRAHGRLDCCPLNFTDERPAPTSILDLDQINTLVALVNRLHAEATGAPLDLPRVPLADLATGAV